MIVFGMLVFVIFWMSVWWFTVSNALDMSSAIAIVLWGGCFLLNPVVIMLFIVCSAVLVEC